jgi:hypothetical protein
MISDIIRKLNLLMITRSKWKIIQSCLNVIADGLEFIFQTKNQFDLETKSLFEDEKNILQNLIQIYLKFLHIEWLIHHQLIFNH